jgi:NADPH:quinone reductase-like Zn-dependent oxidoreductase
MSVQKGIIVGPDATPTIVTDRLLPTIRNDCVLVEVKAVSLNPADWKSLGLKPPSTGSGLGCDYAGIVKAVPVSRFTTARHAHQSHYVAWFELCDLRSA